MKLNRIKAVLSEKGISQTWLAKQLDKRDVYKRQGAMKYLIRWKKCSETELFA